MGLAFSRDQKEKVYVQNKILDDKISIEQDINHKKGYLYLCGSKGSAKDIENMLNDIGITRKLFDSNNIIFIDHSHTGETPCLFAKIILRCLGYISKYSYNLNEYSEKKFSFINIVSNEQYPSWIKIPSKNYINLIGYLLMPNLVAFANESPPKNSIHKIPRSIPHYPHYRWNESPDYTSVIEGKHSIMKLILLKTNCKP